MSVIKIDPSVWTTPVKYAEMKGVSIQVVFNWMKRGKLEVWHIEELNLKLVKIEAQ